MPAITQPSLELPVEFRTTHIRHRKCPPPHHEVFSQTIVAAGHCGHSDRASEAVEGG